MMDRKPDQPPDSPPRNEAKWSVTPIGVAELARRVSKDDSLRFAIGETIKQTGEAQASAYVVVQGRVNIERDIVTPMGLESVTIDIVNPGEIFNEGQLFRMEENDDVSNRYIAGAPVELLVITTETLSGKNGLEHILWAFLRAKTRHDAMLRRLCEEVLKNSRVVTRRVKIQELENQAEELRQQVGALKKTVENLNLRLDFLRPVAIQKAHEAWNSLQNSEKVSQAMVELSNFVYQMLAWHGITPTDEQVAEFRRLASVINWQSNEKFHAALDESLLEDELSWDEPAPKTLRGGALVQAPPKHETMRPGAPSSPGKYSGTGTGQMERVKLPRSHRITQRFDVTSKPGLPAPEEDLTDERTHPY